MADLLWEPQPGESGRAFAAFAVYRDLGSDRSLDKAYATARQDQSGIKTVPGYWRQWCVRYQWVDRATAYDAAMRAKEQAARERAQAAEAETWARRRAEEAEQEWAASRQLLDKARLMLQFPLIEQTTEDGKTTVKPARWALRDAATLLETAAKLARLAAGMDTDHVKDTEVTINLVYGNAHAHAAATVPGASGDQEYPGQA